MIFREHQFAGRFRNLGHYKNHVTRPEAPYVKPLKTENCNYANSIIRSLLRQNDVATSFGRHNDVIFASCVGWEHPILL